MKPRRSKLEISLDVLRAARGGDKPTRIMYTSNISWQPLLRIVEDLMAKGLLEAYAPDERDKRTTVMYRTTPAGENALRRAEELSSIIDTP